MLGSMDGEATLNAAFHYAKFHLAKTCMREKMLILKVNIQIIREFGAASPAAFAKLLIV